MYSRPQTSSPLLLPVVELMNPSFRFAVYGADGAKIVKPMAAYFDEKQQRLYVANTEGHTVEAFDQTGKYLFSFGSYGLEPGKLSFPYGIARTSNGDLLVAEAGNRRIQKFSTDGRYRGIFVDSVNKYNIQKPGPLLTDSKGNVYIGDLSGGKVLVFNQTGQLTRTVGGLQYPHGIAVDEKNGLLYIANSGAGEVRVYSLPNNADTPERIITGPGEGTNFGLVRGIAVDHRGQLLVVDSLSCTVRVFDAAGKYQFGFGSLGNEDDRLLYPNGISIDSFGRVYIADWGNNRVVVWVY